MKTIKAKLIVILSFIFIINIVVGFYVMYQNGQANDRLRSVPSTIISSIENSSYLNSLAELIRYEDEVLTQSARNYAYTGVNTWLVRYNQESPKLESAIKSAISKGEAADKKIFESIDVANKALVAMEAQSIQLVNTGNKSGAQAILNSTNYSNQKAVYQSGLEKYYDSKGSSADYTMASSFTELTSITTDATNTNITNGYFIGTLTLVIIISCLVIYLMIHYLVLKPVASLRKATDQIADGNLEQKLLVQSNDELGTLATSFNRMAVRLKESTENIESKISDRTKQLEKLNGFMSGRELKMIDLKKRIQDLEATDENKK